MKKISGLYLITSIVITMMFIGYGRKFINQNENNIKVVQSSASSQVAISKDYKKSEKYLQKINQMKEEMNKYDKSLAPNQKSKLTTNMKSLLQDILIENDSIKATSEEILNYDKNFYIEFGEKYIYNDVKYRIIEFGSKDNDMGASINIYIQCLKNDKVINVENVYSSGQGASLTKLMYYGITIDNEKAYLTIIDEFYGPEYPVLRLYSYENDGTKWVINNSYEEINNEYWKTERRIGIIIIESNKVNSSSKADFDIINENNELQLRIKDKTNNSIIDSKKIILSQGKVKIQ